MAPVTCPADRPSRTPRSDSAGNARSKHREGGPRTWVQFPPPPFEPLSVPSRGPANAQARRVRRRYGSGASERCCPIEADAMHQWVGVAMHDAPIRAVAAINLRDSQRPVLVRQAADLPVLPLDHHENDRVAPGVRLDHLQLRLAAREVARRRPNALGSVVVGHRVDQGRYLDVMEREFIPTLPARNQAAYRAQ